MIKPLTWHYSEVVMTAVASTAGFWLFFAGWMILITHVIFHPFGPLHTRVCAWRAARRYRRSRTFAAALRAQPPHSHPPSLTLTRADRSWLTAAGVAALRRKNFPKKVSPH